MSRARREGWPGDLLADMAAVPGHLLPAHPAVQGMMREGGRQLSHATGAWLALRLLVQHGAAVGLPGSVRSCMWQGQGTGCGGSGLAVSGRVWMQEDEALTGCDRAKCSWLNLPPSASC